MPRPGRKQGVSLLVFSLTLLTLTVPAYALDCVKQTVNRTGVPQTEQLVVFAGAEIIEQVLTGAPFPLAGQIFGPVVLTPLLFFGIPTAFIPSTTDRDPPIGCVSVTGFSVADHEFALLSWTWSSGGVPTAPIADPNHDFMPGLDGTTFQLILQGITDTEATNVRVSARGVPYTLQGLGQTLDSPDLGKNNRMNHEPEEEMPPSEPEEEPEVPCVDCPPDFMGDADGMPPASTLPELFYTPTLRVRASNVPRLFADEILLQFLGNNGTLFLPAGQKRVFQFKIPSELLKGVRPEDLTIIVRGTVRDIRDTEFERTAQYAVQDRILLKRPPVLSNVISKPDVFIAETNEGQQDNVGPLMPVQLCVDVMDTDRNDPKDPLPLLSRVTVATLDPDPRFQAASDFQVNLQGVTQSVLLDPIGRQFVRFCVPVLVRKETPSVTQARIYKVTLFFKDADGERSVDAYVTVRASFRRFH